jgi:hypothetical protein
MVGGSPGPPLPPDDELTQAGTPAALAGWLAHHLGEPFLAAEAIPDMPRSGKLTTTATVVSFEMR